MTYLSPNQLKQYKDKGFVSPINIFSKDKAKVIRDEIELMEKKIPKELKKSGRYNAHLISPLLDEVTHNPNILNAVPLAWSLPVSYPAVLVVVLSSVCKALQNSLCTVVA